MWRGTAITEALNDKLEALTEIYKSHPQATSIAELAASIEELFSDDASPITLSTCHRAKGLEGDRIFIHKAEDLPMKWRNQLDWQKEQEDNLLYVALTRSKRELYIVGEPNWYKQPKQSVIEQTKNTVEQPVEQNFAIVDVTPFVICQVFGKLVAPSSCLISE